MGYKKPLVAVVIFFVLLILMVASFQMYQKYYLTPERVVKKALLNLIKKDSLEYSGDLKMGFFNMHFSGASDSKEGLDKTSWLRTNTKLGATVSMGTESRLIGGALYFKFGPSRNTFIGKTTAADEWIKIDRESITSRLEEMQKAGTASPSWWYSDLTADETAGRLLAKQQLLEKVRPFETIEELKGVKINGTEGRHYAFVINKDQLKEVAVTLREIEEMPYTEEELQSLDEQLEAMKTLSGEVWIGKKDMLPYKIVIKSEDVESDMIGNVVEVSPEEMTPDGIAKASGRKAKPQTKTPQVQFTLNLKNFDKPVKTSVPKYKEPSESEVERMMGLLFPASPKE